jgi:replication fork clamp-binding protein CrfC
VGSNPTIPEYLFIFIFIFFIKKLLLPTFEHLFYFMHNAAKSFTKLQFQISRISQENWKQMQLLQGMHSDNYSRINVGSMFINFKNIFKEKSSKNDHNV